MIQQDVVYLVSQEVERAREKHLPIKSTHEGYAIMLEEVDEFWDDVKVNPRKLSPEDQVALKVNMKKELVQVAAMAVRIILDLNL